MDYKRGFELMKQYMMLKQQLSFVEAELIKFQEEEKKESEAKQKE